MVRLASRAQRAATQAVPCSPSWSQLTGPRRQGTCSVGGISVGSFRRLGTVWNACVAGLTTWGLKASHLTAALMEQILKTPAAFRYGSKDSTTRRRSTTRVQTTGLQQTSLGAAVAPVPTVSPNEPED